MKISVDPGESIGVCEWSERGKLLKKTKLGVPQFMAYLRQLHPEQITTFIVEQWELQGRRALQQSGSKMQSSKVIGYCELYCYLNNLDIVMQDPQIMRITALHFQVSIPPKSHIPDDTAAELHGLHYFLEQGIIKAVAPEHYL